MKRLLGLIILSLITFPSFAQSGKLRGQDLRYPFTAPGNFRVGDGVPDVATTSGSFYVAGPAEFDNVFYLNGLGSGNKLLWIDSSGLVKVVTLGTGISFNATTGVLSADGGVTAEDQPPNKVFAGPTSGGDDAPTFRNLVETDIPSLAGTKITAGTLPLTRIDTTGAATGKGIFYDSDGNLVWTDPGQIPITAFGGIAGDSTDDRDAIAAAVTQMNVNGGGVLYFPPGEYNLNSSVTTSPTVTFRFAPGAFINVASGVNQTILGNVDAPQTKIFDGDGVIKFTGNQKVKQVSATWFGAKGDGAIIETDGTHGWNITTGTPTLTTNVHGFTSADLYKTVSVAGAGPGGGPLTAEIIGFSDSSTVTLDTNASTTVTFAKGSMGWDNTEAVQSALNSLNASTDEIYIDRVDGGEVALPPGVYKFSAPIEFPLTSVRIRGSGRGTTGIIAPPGEKFVQLNSTVYAPNGNTEFMLADMTIMGTETEGDGVIDTTVALAVPPEDTVFPYGEIRFRFENLNVVRMGGRAITIGRSTTFCNITRSYFSDNAGDVFTGVNADVVIEDNQFTQSTGTAAHIVTEGLTAKIINNIFMRGSEDAGTGPDILVQGVTDLAEGSVAGIGGYLNITGNKFGPEFEDASRIKIHVFSASGETVNNLKIYSNNFQGIAGQTAIKLDNPLNAAQIHSNTFDGFGTLVNDNQAVEDGNIGLNGWYDNVVTEPNTRTGTNTVYFTNGGRGFTLIRNINAGGELPVNSVIVEKEAVEISNLIKQTNGNFESSDWVKSSGVSADDSDPTTDPYGGTKASKITRAASSPSPFASQSISTPITITSMKSATGEAASDANGRLIVKFWAKAGSFDSVVAGVNDTTETLLTQSEVIKLSGAWRKYKMTFSGLDTSHTYSLSFFPGSVGAEAGDLYLAFPQVSTYDCDFVPTTTAIYGPVTTLGQNLQKSLATDGSITAGGTITATGLLTGSSVVTNVSTQTGDFTAGSAHTYLVSGTTTASLQSASVMGNRDYTFVNTGSGTVTIDPSGTQALDGVTSGTLVLGPGESANVACNAVSWWVTNRKYAVASGTSSGTLTATDWNAFDDKLSSESDTLADVTGRGSSLGTSITPSSDAAYSLGSLALNFVTVFSDTFKGSETANMLNFASNGVTLNAGDAGDVLTLGSDANPVINFPTQTTVGAAGGASALPATPLGYINIVINGTPAVIPYYSP